MKTSLLFVSLLIAAPALADQTVRMSDGRICTFRNGEFTGCTRNDSRSTNRPPSVAETYLMQKTEDRKRLHECLRVADWPGKPGRAECERLYGR
jgi:hypothetical protein